MAPAYLPSLNAARQAKQSDEKSVVKRSARRQALGPHNINLTSFQQSSSGASPFEDRNAIVVDRKELTIVNLNQLSRLTNN